MFHFLLESVLPVFEHCLEMYTFHLCSSNLNLKMTGTADPEVPGSIPGAARFSE
jgi:hypothetical protein